MPGPDGADGDVTEMTEPETGEDQLAGERSSGIQVFSTPSDAPASDGRPT